MKLICYLCNGYPSIEQSEKLADQYMEAGCDVLEIDVPSHDPYLESDLIAGRMEMALKACDKDDAYLEEIARIRRKYPQKEIIFLLYENTVERIGVEKVVGFCRENGISDMIYVGMKHPDIKQKLIDGGIKVSCYVQYHLPEEEIEFAKHSNGFVYLQARPTTGNIKPGYEKLEDCIRYIRDQGIERPIYCGVGVHTEEDLKMVREAGADGAFIGSAILKVDDQPEKLMETIRNFKRACELS